MTRPSTPPLDAVDPTCRLCGGTGRINECPQSCDGSHREDLTWTCYCAGDRTPSDTSRSVARRLERSAQAGER